MVIYNEKVFFIIYRMLVKTLRWAWNSGGLELAQDKVIALCTATFQSLNNTEIPIKSSDSAYTIHFLEFSFTNFIYIFDNIVHVAPWGFECSYQCSSCLIKHVR